MKEHLLPMIKRIWGRASTFERVLLCVVPAVTVIDFLMGNWISFVLDLMILAWVSWSVWNDA